MERKILKYATSTHTIEFFWRVFSETTAVFPHNMDSSHTDSKDMLEVFFNKKKVLFLTKIVWSMNRKKWDLNSSSSSTGVFSTLM